MVRKAYIRHRESYPENENTFAALEGFRQRGVEIAPFYGFGDIETLPDLARDVCLVGHLGDVWTALKCLGITQPPSLDYPEELSDFLGRRLWRSDIKTIRGMTQRVFVKPVKQKLFTGFALTGHFRDMLRIGTYPEDEEVWVSEPVEFVAEYRAFILRHEILDVRAYKGDWSKAPDRRIVENIVTAWKDAPIACSVDIGITSDGRTLLVEVNDGYALGSYGLYPTLYAQMIEARWEEMVG